MIKILTMVNLHNKIKVAYKKQIQDHLFSKVKHYRGSL